MMFEHLVDDIPETTEDVKHFLSTLKQETTRCQHSGIPFSCECTHCLLNLNYTVSQGLFGDRNLHFCIVDDIYEVLK